MNVFELIFFIVHVAVFAAIAALFAMGCGWPAGLIAGAVAVCLLAAFERMLAALLKRRRDRNGAGNIPRI